MSFSLDHFDSLSIKARKAIIFLCHNWLVIGLCLLGVFLGQLLHIDGLTTISSILLVAHLITVRFVSQWLQEKLIRDVACPGCGNEIDLIGIYRCACGYQSPNNRSALSPCEHCGKTFEMLRCDCCGTSLIL